MRKLPVSVLSLDWPDFWIILTVDLSPPPCPPFRRFLLEGEMSQGLRPPQIRMWEWKSWPTRVASPHLEQVMGVAAADATAAEVVSTTTVLGPT